jgi:hypothetical protein
MDGRAGRPYRFLQREDAVSMLRIKQLGLCAAVELHRPHFVVVAAGRFDVHGADRHFGLVHEAI